VHFSNLRTFVLLSGVTTAFDQKFSAPLQMSIAQCPLACSPLARQCMNEKNYSAQMKVPISKLFLLHFSPVSRDQGIVNDPYPLNYCLKA
jgi:hypothetical protein